METHSKKHTKIVATVSDKRCDVDFIRNLSRAGLNVVRMNSAHLELEGFTKIVNNVRTANDHLAIIMDTKGPEIRTTATSDGNNITFRAGETVRFVGDPSSLSTHDMVCLNYADIANDVNVGDRLLIDDGELAFTIIEMTEGVLTCNVENDGDLGSRKSVNVPGVSIKLPAVTERDKRNIGYAIDLGVDFIAHSFVRSAADVKEVQDILNSRGSDIKIISKIENQEGVDNFDEILEASYGIMIARGDLGIEVPAEQIPGIQIMMIEKCISRHKPVIVATQMLHTMIENPRPTRAEVSDVAGAVLQRADAMMLSGETAYGKYPVEAVETMSRIAEQVEHAQSAKPEVPPMSDALVTSFLSRQAVVSENQVGTRAIITDSYNGMTARYIASFRGKNPTIAICYNRSVQRWLSLSYGVTTYLCSNPTQCDKGHYPVETMSKLIEIGMLKSDDRIAYISGTQDGATSLEIDTLSNFMA